MHTLSGCPGAWMLERGWASSSRGPCSQWECSSKDRARRGLDVKPSVTDRVGAWQKDETRVARGALWKKWGF